MNCIFCGKPTDGGTVHWVCGGVLPDDPRHAAISAADHIVRVLSPKRIQRADGRYVRKPAEALSRERLRANLRPELLDAFDDGVALALQAGAIVGDHNMLRLAPSRRSVKQRDNGTEAGLFELPARD